MPFGHPLVSSGLLGDASIPWRKGKPVLSVEFVQALKRDDYIWHLYDIGLRVGFGASLSRSGDFVGTPPQVRYKHGGGDYQSLRFPTYGHPEFKFYDDLFYPAHDRRSGWSYGP